jgi:hypothetical protein
VLKMNKRGDTSMLEFLMRLLLAFIIFVPVIFFVSKYFFSSNDYQNTLDAISDKIVELKKTPNTFMDNVPLRFGKEGSVIAFSKSSERIVLVERLAKAGDIWANTKPLSFDRPAACKDACFCVCSEKFVDKKNDGVIVCGGKLACESLEYYDFPSKFAFNTTNKEGSEFSQVHFEGGFFLEYFFPVSYNTLFIRQSGSLLCFSPVNQFGCFNG